MAKPGGTIMQTTISARHSEVPEALRERATTVVERLDKVTPRAIDMAVVFDSDGLEHTAELRLHMASGEILVARGGGPDHRTALDRAEEKLRRQVERTSDRPRKGRVSHTKNPL
jgi:ribosomal subunit interface protein